MQKNTDNSAAKQKPQGLKNNIEVAHLGGNVAKVARENLEETLVDKVISKGNKLNYVYIEDEKLLKNNK